MQFLASDNDSNSPEYNICTTALPIAVASPGPAYTVQRVYLAVS